MAFVSNPGFLAAAFIECSAAFILLVLYVLLAPLCLCRGPADFPPVERRAGRPTFPFRGVPGHSRRLLYRDSGVQRPRPKIEVPVAGCPDLCHHRVPARKEILRNGDLGGVDPRVLAVHRGWSDPLAFPTPA